MSGSQVRTLKGNFGFIRCCQRSGDLFFHYTTLQGCTKADLKKGDDVEFSVERNPEHGTIAVRYLFTRAWGGALNEPDNAIQLTHFTHSRTIKGFWQRSERSDFVCSVRKMPPGSAVFETISEEEFTGVVHTAALHYSNGEAAYESVSGVVSLTEDGQPAKLLFGTRDFKVRCLFGTSSGKTRGRGVPKSGEPTVSNLCVGSSSPAIFCWRCRIRC